MTLLPPERAPRQAPDRSPFRSHLLLIPIAALVAVAPLIRHGGSCGHDFDFHLLNWMEAARQFSHGNLHPHWAFTPAFNAGEPRFVFYPPLSWFLGALLGLVLTHLPGVTEATAWSATPIVFTWIALTLAGLTLHRLARTFVSSNAAVLAATLYLTNPYMLFTAYERTAFAELLAAAWIPLLLYAVLRDRVTIPRIALPIALLWLTNAPAAVMGSYALAFLAAIRIVSAYRIGTTARVPQSAPESRDQSPYELAFKTLTGTALGFALAAFYIIPAAYERRYVQIAMATIAGMRIDQNFLFEHTGTSPDALLHDQVLHTASLIALLLLAITVVGLIAMRHSTKPSALYPDSEASASQHTIHFPILPLAILTGGIALLLTPLSLPLWNHAPQALFLQFPWRLLAILAPISALTTAAVINRFTIKYSSTVIATVLLAAVLSSVAYQLFRQPCDSEDTAPARLALFHSSTGSDPTDEYTPTTADNDALTQKDPPYWLSTDADGLPPSAAQPGPAPMHLDLTVSRTENLILNLRDYPAWRVALNNQPEMNRAPRADGLIAIPIPAGNSDIEIKYAHTFDETSGDAITLAAIAILVLTCRRKNLHRRRAAKFYFES